MKEVLFFNTVLHIEGLVSLSVISSLTKDRNWNKIIRYLYLTSLPTENKLCSYLKVK